MKKGKEFPSPYEVPNYKFDTNASIPPSGSVSVPLRGS